MTAYLFHNKLSAEQELRNLRCSGVNNCKIREVIMYEIYEDSTEKTLNGDVT
jgi:hypothetical protein